MEKMLCDTVLCWVGVLHYSAAHLFIFSFCLAILILDPIHEQPQAQTYPRRLIKTSYTIRIPELKG